MRGNTSAISDVPVVEDLGGKPGHNTERANSVSETHATHGRAPVPDDRGASGTLAWRSCRRCRVKRPITAFPLLNDPTQKARGYATRHWCGPCLIERGHIKPPPRPRLALVPPAPPKEYDQATRNAVSAHVLTVEVVDALLGVEGLAQRVFAHPDAVEVLVRAMTSLAISQENDDAAS